MNETSALILALVVGGILVVISILVMLDQFSTKGIFFFLVKNKYIETTATIRRERITNVVYGGSDGGYGGYRQKEYKMDYTDNQGNLHKLEYKTGMSESKFAFLLDWKVGTRIKVLYSPKNSSRVVINKEYYKKQLKLRQQKAEEEWNRDY